MRTKGLAGYDLDGLRRLLRCVRIGLAMRPDTVHRTGERIGGAGSDEQLTSKLAAIWAELARRGEMERIMEDEREEDEEYPSDRSDQTDRSDKDRNGKSGPAAAPVATADNVLGMCTVEGCPGDALRDGICKRHLIKLAAGDKEAAEAVRRWHAVHDRQPETPRVPRWKRYPEEETAEPGTRPQDPLRENTEQGKASNFRPRASGTATTTEDGEQVRSSGPEACSLKPEASPPSQETTMATKRRCEKCGKMMDPRGLAKHEPLCKGPGPTTFPCPTCGKGHKSEHGLHCHEAHTGHGDKDGSQSAVACPVGAGSREKQPPKPKRKYTRRLPTVNQTAGAKVRIHLPAPAAIRDPQSAIRNQDPAPYASPMLAKLGHAFIRLAELLGLAEILADYPHPDGLVLVNTRNGNQALITAAGEIEAVELTRRPNA